ncbi:MAG: hypothetical protein ABL907_25680, partial [Hyphomicrobium sp.]
SVTIVAAGEGRARTPVLTRPLSDDDPSPPARLREGRPPPDVLGSSDIRLLTWRRGMEESPAHHPAPASNAAARKSPGRQTPADPC